MTKIAIIGSAGAGKSTLSRQLGDILECPVYHLDTYYWKPGWIPTPNEEWDSFMGNLVKEERWIMDGNYGRTLDIRLKQADTIILLDLPKWITIYRVLKRRIMYHGKIRPDMNPGCPESLDFEFIKWVWNFRRKNLPGIMAKIQQYEDKQVIILKSRKAVGSFLAQAEGGKQ